MPCETSKCWSKNLETDDASFLLLLLAFSKKQCKLEIIASPKTTKYLLPLIFSYCIGEEIRQGKLCMYQCIFLCLCICFCETLGIKYLHICLYLHVIWFTDFWTWHPSLYISYYTDWYIIYHIMYYLLYLVHSYPDMASQSDLSPNSTRRSLS